MQKLPLDVQSFEKMREEDYLYVDKTRHIHKMVSEGTYYFLSRPRRFGKSLFVSTLKCFFEGRKELFQGLWIAEHGGWDWQEHPVINLSFNELSSRSPEILEQSLNQTLQDIAEDAGLSLQSTILELRFSELIRSLNKQTGRTVAVLIDEYDKPIIDHLGKGKQGLDIAKANRDLLQSFFGVLKGNNISPLLRAVFLTGISRFSKVSIFSELNNLIDLSMSDAYADILGYTQEELEARFEPYIKKLSETYACSRGQTLQSLARQYNGYRFCTSTLRVYNPFSILHAFHSLSLQDYWFETATPSFLIDLLRQEQFSPVELEGLEVTQSIFTSFDLERLSPTALLFQTGYLSISGVQEKVFRLDYPNQEVKHAFSESFFLALAESKSGGVSSQVLKLSAYLQQQDLQAFFESMRAIFASIPYTLNSKRDEAYFHTIFYLMLSASGVDADSEVLTSEGRIDLAVTFENCVYIFEFKCNQSANAAMQQIQDNAYADKYRGQGKQIFSIGINFDMEIRNVSEWKIVEIQTERS